MKNFAIGKNHKGLKVLYRKPPEGIGEGMDFHASQQRFIYDLHKDNIIDNYLYENRSNKKPKLISCIQ